MPKKLDAELLAQIEENYLFDSSQTYATLAKKFDVGKSTLERIGKERNWSSKRDQQSSEKLIKQSKIVNQSLEKLNLNGLVSVDQFGQARLLKIIQKALLTFELAIDESGGDNPRLLSTLASGLCKLVEIHLRLEPLTANDLVEILIRLDVGPEQFLAQLQQQRKLNTFQN